MKKALLTLAALGILNSGIAAKETAPLSIVTKGIHPLEQKILDNSAIHSGILFDLYYDNKFPDDSGWLLFTTFNKADSSRISMEFNLSYPSIFGYFFDDIRRNYRSVTTSKDSLFCATKNSYYIGGENIVGFFENLRTSLVEKPLQSYIETLPVIHYNILKEVKKRDNYYELKRIDLGFEFKKFENIYGTDYLLVSILPLNSNHFKSLSFFISQDGIIPWMYADAYCKFRLINRNFKDKITERDEFYRVFKSVYKK